MDELRFRNTTAALPNKAKGIKVVESPSTLPVSLAHLLTQSVAHMSLQMFPTELLLVLHSSPTEGFAATSTRGKQKRTWWSLCRNLPLLVSETAFRLLLIGCSVSLNKSSSLPCTDWIPFEHLIRNNKCKWWNCLVAFNAKRWHCNATWWSSGVRCYHRPLLVDKSWEAFEGSICLLF